MNTIVTTRPPFRARRQGLPSQSGQGMVEYALILLCMALVLIVIVGVIGHSVNSSFSNVANQFPQ